VNTSNNISQEQLETIERYINDRMSPEERLEFKTQLNSDSNLQAQFQETKSMILGIESAAIRNELDSFHEDMVPVRMLDTSEEETTTSSRSLGKRVISWSIAASIILALGIFTFMDTDSPSEQLFAKHFTPDPGLPTVMSTTNEFSFYDAMVNYKQEKYTLAIEKWETLLPNKPANDTLNFYLGVSYLAEGNAARASDYLSETLKVDSSIFTDDALYFAALAEIKQDNFEAANKLLVKSESKRSKALLSELSK